MSTEPKATLSSTLATATAPFAVLAAVPVAHAVLQHSLGSTSQHAPMDIDSTTAPTNQHNPYNLRDNCVFVSMAYLLDQTVGHTTAHDLVAITGEMQPADGSGGIDRETLERMLGQVKAKKGVEYMIKKWDTKIKPTEWCTSKFRTDRFALGYLRHDPKIPCTHPQHPEGSSRDSVLDTRCTVVENADQPMYQGKDLSISGHCVVYDAKAKVPGFFDFQSDGTPTSTLNDKLLYIEEHGKTCFAIMVDKNAMEVDG